MLNTCVPLFFVYIDTFDCLINIHELIYMGNPIDAGLRLLIKLHLSYFWVVCITQYVILKTGICILFLCHLL